MVLPVRHTSDPTTIEYVLYKPIPFLVPFFPISCIQSILVYSNYKGLGTIKKEKKQGRYRWDDNTVPNPWYFSVKYRNSIIVQSVSPHFLYFLSFLIPCENFSSHTITRDGPLLLLYRASGRGGHGHHAFRPDYKLKIADLVFQT